MQPDYAANRFGAPTSSTFGGNAIVAGASSDASRTSGQRSKSVARRSSAEHAKDVAMGYVSDTTSAGKARDTK